MDESYPYKAKPYQYSQPSFEKTQTTQQNYSGYQGYLGNDGLDFQESRRREELRYHSHSQGSSDLTMKHWATKEPDYPSDKDVVPRSINIKPCSQPLIGKEELNEVNSKVDARQDTVHNRSEGTRSTRGQIDYLSPQYGDRKNQSHNYSNHGVRKQTEPHNATAKFGEKDLPRSAEKKIIFNLSPQASHPTRDHLSPDSIRYAKMSEDEAAQTFEARRKALIDNLRKQTEANTKDGSAEEPEEKRSAKVSTKKMTYSTIQKKIQDKKKTPSSASTTNRTNPRQAPVPIKSLRAELEKAKKKNQLNNTKPGPPKPKMNEETISSIPSSAITPHRQSIDSGTPLPTYKSLSPKQGIEKLQKRIGSPSSILSPKLAAKKEIKPKPKRGEDTIELKKLFNQTPKIVVNQHSYSRAAEQEAIYPADDEVYRENEQGFLNPRSTVKKEDPETAETEKVGRGSPWSPEPRQVKVIETTERARTELREERMKKDEIKSKFIRRKRKVSDEANNQENLTEDYRSDEEIRPYSSLNEKGFESHHAYLHERALLQKKNRDIAHQQSKQQSKEREIERCTFRPTIGSPPKFREGIVEKTKKWQIAREQQIIENKAAAIEKELNECTFYPNNALANLDGNQHNFNNFLKRNNEWNQKRVEEIKKKEEELFQKSHSSSIRSTYVRSPQREGIVPKRTCCQEKEHAQTKPATIKSSKSQKSLKGPQKLEVHQCQHTTENEKEIEIEIDSYRKPEERRTTIVNNLDPIQETQQDLKTTLQMATQEFEEIDDVPQIEDDISQSHRIIQNIQRILTEKQEIKKLKESHRKVDIDLLLKTTGEQFLRESGSLEKLHQHESHRKIRNTLKSRGNSISPSRNQSSFFKEVPITSLDYDSDLFQGNSYRVTLKNNKYFVSPKRELQSEIKNLMDLNSSPSAKVSDFLGEGDGMTKTKGILMQRNSRDSSAKRTKTVTISPDTKSPKMSYISGRDPDQLNSSFKYVPSDVMINIEPQPTFNQRYVEIINQASQMTTQLGQLGYQTYMSDWNN